MGTHREHTFEKEKKNGLHSAGIEPTKSRLRDECSSAVLQALPRIKTYTESQS